MLLVTTTFAFLPICKTTKSVTKQQGTLHFLGTETRPVVFHNKSVSSNTTGVYFFLESTMAYKAKESFIFFFDSFQLKQGKGPFKLDTECETESIIYHENTFSVAS